MRAAERISIWGLGARRRAHVEEVSDVQLNVGAGVVLSLHEGTAVLAARRASLSEAVEDLVGSAQKVGKLLGIVQST